MTSGEAYTIYRGDQSGCVLYVGVGGQVKVTTSGGDTVTFYNLNNGQFVPVNVKKVFATGTTATNPIAPGKMALSFSRTFIDHDLYDHGAIESWR